MIARAEKRVVINRPVASVFEFVLNGSNNRLWKRLVIEVRPPGEPPYELGSRFEQEVQGPGGPVRADYEITEYKENQRIGLQVVAGPARWRGRYVFRAQQAATRLTYALEYAPSEYDPAVAKQILGDMQRVLQEEQAALASLSPQERRALSLRTDGQANAEIARTMFVGEGTVRNYVFSGLTKLVTPRVQQWMEAEVGTIDELKAFLEKIA